jgi:hypothetical protein
MPERTRPPLQWRLPHALAVILSVVAAALRSPSSSRTPVAPGIEFQWTPAGGYQRGRAQLTTQVPTDTVGELPVTCLPEAPSRGSGESVKGDGQEDGCCWAAYLQFTVKENIGQILYLMVKDANDSFQKPFFRQVFVFAC